MNKDSSQKDMLFKHFYSLGWFAQPEVVVFHKGGVNEQKKVITDIDVLALRPGTDLSWELVLGDCKTLKGQSPANRALWLRGLMNFFNASEGLLVLKKEQPMEADHKLFASSFNVTLLDENEFDEYDKAVIYPNGSSNYPLTLNQIQRLINIQVRYPKLKPLVEYLYILSWNENNFIDIVRKLIGEAQQIYQEIDPSIKEHLALILDTCAIFSIGLAECVGIIFKQYFKPSTHGQLDESLKYLLWGGRSQYDFVARLRNELIAAKRTPATPLALPEWERFMQLVRSLLEYPALAFSLPILFRNAAINVLFDQPFLGTYNSDKDLLLLKFGMLVYNYFCRAAKFPPQAREILEGEFVRKQSSVLSMSRNASDKEEGSQQSPVITNTTSITEEDSQRSDHKTPSSEHDHTPKNNIQPELPLEKNTKPVSDQDTEKPL